MTLFGQQRLPYTAEVEWLESTNISNSQIQQQIMTGLNGNQVYGIETLVTDVATTIYGVFIGNGYSDFTFGADTIGDPNPTKSFVYIRKTAYWLNSGQALDATKHLIIRDGKVKCNGREFGSYDTSLPLSESEKEVAMFGIDNARNASCRIHYCKLFGEDGIVLRDFIPVRVGNEGFMYDKVTKKLFENVKTGNLIIGSDVRS